MSTGFVSQRSSHLRWPMHFMDTMALAGTYTDIHMSCQLRWSEHPDQTEQTLKTEWS